MKKFLPFVFPFIALVIVLFLAVRWYNSKTTHSQEKIAEFGDNIKIEEVTPTNQNNLRQMAKDVKKIELKGDNTQGEMRYEVRDGKLEFTINADLPELSKGVYQVWLKQVNGDAKKKAFVLMFTKGGYTGSASVSIDALPFEIVISKEMQNDNVMETVIMKGSISVENTR